ncbi:MAG: HD-GYP domain-containing protein [Oscillospiraceae bacterium]|nr:HD-GYP domain-containing protein [Oscillospiraceae bacterium]
MVFVKTEDLAAGMCIARNINFYDSSNKTAQTFEAGRKLTDVAITQLRTSNVDGVYVDTVKSEVRMISSINQQIRSEAISGIHSLADNFMNSEKGVQKGDVESISNTAQNLIDSLSSHKDILVNIADIKMYDDYTYHHSLSVAIMALAIGIELGFPNNMLNELGVAGLLHDVGKVSVPIEIITKPGRLTKEEFEVVRMHPVYAAQHLKERNLVNDNIFKGIIQHHEKMDGTGYPYKLSGKQIHPYARILAVADVYDALTSNRPYRIPNPPNEAIEFIMAGNETHFDEQIIRAFLRKVAPFPVGAKVKLSNGENATVLKNYPDAPLRPMVSVTDSAKCYNLYMDTTYHNIVITGLLENKDNMRLINM